MGIEITNSNLKSVMSEFLSVAQKDVQGSAKSAAITVNGDKIGVSTSDKPGFLGALFRSKADVQANNETRQTFLTGLKMMFHVSTDGDLEAKLGADVLKLSDFHDNKGHPLSAFRISTIMNKVKDLGIDLMKNDGDTSSEPVKMNIEEYKPEEGSLSFAASMGTGRSGFQHVATLEPDYSLGLRIRAEREPISEIPEWQKTTTATFVKETIAELKDCDYNMNDKLVESFDKLGQFFERETNAAGFKGETPQTIANHNKKLLGELSGSLKIFNPEIALRQMMLKAMNLNNEYGSYMVRTITALMDEMKNI